jgi:uncharacterized repeat protein (TIGR02543 family)
VVILSPPAAAGYSFTGWSGDCAGFSCSLTMNSAKSVTANYAPSCTVSFNKASYTVGDLMTITYNNAPASSILAIRNPSDVNVQTWTVTGSDIQTFTAVAPTGSWDATLVKILPVCSVINTATVNATANNPPNAMAVNDAPDPVNVGAAITFTGNWAEPDAGDNVKMYICKDVACTNCNNIFQDNCWCNSSAFNTQPDNSDTCTYTTQAADNGARPYWLGVCDDQPSCDATPLAGGTFTVSGCTRNNPEVVFLPPKNYVGNPGTPALYQIKITNRDAVGCGPSQFQVAALLPPGWTTWSISDDSPELDPAETMTLNFSVTSPTNALPNVYNIGASFINLSAPGFFGRDGTATYEVLRVCERYLPEVVLDPDFRNVVAGTPVTYTVKVKNMDAAGCDPSQFILSRACAGAWPQCVLDQFMFPAIAPAGTFQTTFRVTSPSDAAPNPYPVTVTAFNSNPQSGLSQFVNGTYIVSAAVCDKQNPEITLDPPEKSGNPGEELTYIVNVTNKDGLDCLPSNFFLTSSCEPGWPTCHLGQQNFSAVPPQTSFSTTLNVKSLVTSAAGDYDVAITAKTSPAGSSTTFVGNYRVRGPCQVVFDSDTYNPGDTMKITYTDAPPPAVAGIVNLTLCPPESPCTQWSVEGSDTIDYPVGAPPPGDLEDNWGVNLLVPGVCDAFDVAWVTSGAPIPNCTVHFEKNVYVLGTDEKVIIHYENSPKPPAPGVVDLTLVAPDKTVQQWSVQGTGFVEYPLDPSDTPGQWGASLYIGGIPIICDVHATTDVSAVPLTCEGEEMGGTCCPADKPICTAGKITGTSDCAECCRYAADCGTAAAGPVTPWNPLKAGSFEEFITTLINLIFWVALGIVPLLIIIAGFYFMTSGGDPERIRKAKTILIYTLIGFTIVLLARGIIEVIRRTLGG